MSTFSYEDALRAAVEAARDGQRVVFLSNDPRAVATDVRPLCPDSVPVVPMMRRDFESGGMFITASQRRFDLRGYSVDAVFYSDRLPWGEPENVGPALATSAVGRVVAYD